MASYGYFATGELQTQTLAGGTATFAYFTNGQLKQAQVPTVPPGPPVVADYVYGPDQLRIKRTVAGAPVYTLRGVGGEILSHYEAPCGALSWSRDDLYGAGRLLGSVRRAPTAFVAFVSAAGSVNEGTAQATVPVRVTTTNGQPLPCAATVSYQTTGGTATSDGDFAATTVR